MKNSYVTFLALLALSVLSTSCGDAAGKKVSDSNSKTTQFMEASKTAIKNLGEALDAQAFITSSCGATGLPSVAFGTGNYYVDAFPCALKTDSKNFQTLQGIMSVYSGLLCAIEDQVTFNYANSATTHNITISATDSCLSGISLGSAGSFAIQVIEQSISGNWDFKITIDLPSSGMNASYSGKRMYVYLRENGQEKGIKVSIGTYVSAGNSHNNFTGLFLAQDLSTNTFRFDMYSENKHQRGVMTSTNSDFSSIVSFFGAHSAASNQVMSYYSGGGTYKYQATPGAVCFPGGDCALAGAPGTDFADFFTNSGVLTSSLVNDTAGVLTFTNSAPAQFFP
ncbi:MAG: hypothetical protein ACOVP4_06100 [Bacteriovoracaceae bacterium]|jgi:hypothetical protein